MHERQLCEDDNMHETILMGMRWRSVFFSRRSRFVLMLSFLDQKESRNVEQPRAKQRSMVEQPRAEQRSKVEQSSRFEQVTWQLNCTQRKNSDRLRGAVICGTSQNPQSLKLNIGPLVSCRATLEI